MKDQVIRLSISMTVIASLVWTMTGCMSGSASSRYFGSTTPPSTNMLRYVSGSEPESLDPAVSNSQPDARIYMSMYDGLIEYEPKTMEAIPAIAKSWEIGEEGTEYIFHLRDNAKFSNGAPLTAHDFVFTMVSSPGPVLIRKRSGATNSRSVFISLSPLPRIFARKVFSARNLSAMTSMSAAGFSRVIVAVLFLAVSTFEFATVTFAEFDDPLSLNCEQPRVTAVSRINGTARSRVI